MQNNYKLTKYTCYLFYILQGTLLNITPVLFVPLMEQFGLSYVQLGTLVSINFAVQLGVDVLLSKMVDKKGYRLALQVSAVAAFVGYGLFAWMPGVSDVPYVWLLIGMVLMAIGSGYMEITISPLIHALPDKAKGKNMALLHSFYAWGQLLTVIVTTVMLAIIGRENWHLIVTGWMIFPVVGFILSCIIPVPDIKPEENSSYSFKIFKEPMFIVFLLMIFFGACSENIMVQWSSAYMEQAMGLNKVIGDIAGMSMFAVMLGACRVLSAMTEKKIKLYHYMLYGSLLAIVCYFVVALTSIPALALVFCALTGFATAMLWPGTLVLGADYFPKAGAWLFAYLAIAGDLGGVFGPWLTGTVADKAGLSAGMLVSAIFPVISTLCIIIYLKKNRDNKRLRKL